MCDLTTLTSIELEHAQSKRHMAWTNSTICRVQGPYQALWSKDSSDFYYQFWHNDRAGHLLRRLDIEIWWFLFGQQMDRPNHFTPCACAQGNKLTSVSGVLTKLYFFNSSMIAILTSSRANLIATQLRGPKPNGMWASGGRLALSSGVNLQCCR